MVITGQRWMWRNEVPNSYIDGCYIVEVITPQNTSNGLVKVVQIIINPIKTKIAIGGTLTLKLDGHPYFTLLEGQDVPV